MAPTKIPVRARQSYVVIHSLTVNADADSSAGDAATAETAPPAKIRKFKLNTREGVRAFIEFAHEPNADTGTMAFHWKTWGNGVNKKVRKLFRH
jgi:hypothetical protein